MQDMTNDARTALSGIWLPLVTPFRDGRLDERSLARLTRHYAGEALDGLILGATTGEGLTLEDREVERVVAVVTDTLTGLGHRLPVFLGLAGADTQRMARIIHRTAGWPIDGYLISAPYYLRPSQAGLYRHFVALAGCTERPVLLYNIPYRTGVNIANDTLLRLADLPNVVGLKDCAADAGQSVDLLRRRPADFAVLTGEDALFHTALCQGADGGILGAAHVETAAFRAVYEAQVANDAALALRLWRDLADLPRLLFAEPSPAPIKHWLWRAGLIDSPEVRMPMTEISAGLATRLDSERAARAGLEAGQGAA